MPEANPIVPIPKEDDVALEMNDDGQLQFDPEQMAAVEKFITETATGEPTEKKEDAGTATSDEEGNKIVSPQQEEKRLLYEHMIAERERDKQQIDILKLQLQQLLQSQQFQSTDPNAPKFSEMINDDEKGPQLIDKLVDLKLEKKLEGLNLPGLYETIGRLASKIEYDSFKSAHPNIVDPATKDVRQSIKDVMIPLLNGDKNLTYEAVYTRLQKARVFGDPAGKESILATPSKEPTLPKKDLVARADALKTESGVSARQIGNKPIETFKDAYLQAWDDVTKGN